MLHVPSVPSSSSPRGLLALPLLLLATLGCPAASEGDDLPPGAFTTGGDDDVDPPDTDDTTTDAPGESTTSDEPTTTTPPPDTGNTDDGPPGMVSHAADVQPIWTANCILASCHDSDAPISNVDLQSDGVRDRLCATNSTTQPSIALVDCEGFDPEASWVWSKVTGEGLEAPGAGTLMPVGGMLSADDIATIEAWIEGGALP